MVLGCPPLRWCRAKSSKSRMTMAWYWSPWLCWSHILRNPQCITCWWTAEIGAFNIAPSKVRIQHFQHYFNKLAPPASIQALQGFMHLRLTLYNDESFNLLVFATLTNWGRLSNIQIPTFWLASNPVQFVFHVASGGLGPVRKASVHDRISAACRVPFRNRQ